MQLDKNTNSPFAVQIIYQNGKYIEFISDQIKPFNFSDLINVKGDGKTSFNLNISTSFVDMSSIGEDIDGAMELSLPIAFHNKPKIFALVDGGWLPPAFVSPPNFLVDRNVVSVLSQVSSGSIRTDQQSTNWWLQFPTLSDVSINPVLYALEGCKQTSQTFEEFCRSFEEAYGIIERTLPNTTILSYSDADYKVVYEFISNAVERHERETKFLVSVAPTLVARCADNKLSDCRKYILEKTDLFGLNRKSLVVLAALSCIYEPKDGNGLLAAREVLKPNKEYSEREAFNSISDLQALEIYILSLSPDIPRHFLCTCDRGLAGLWCGLKPKNIHWNGDDFSYDMAINEVLFPRLKEEERNESFLFQ